ncbi:MAG: hypothetical protein HY923_07615 [Elusimicrobia bacterium]|nr:hypothetical protein [Elusimicrobiota bacterium]
MELKAHREESIRRCRIALGTFMAGLVVSGLTAFPLLREVRLLSAWAGPHPWLDTVRAGLETSYAAYPWLAYGTDWLAFGHIVIALFFIGPFLDPARNRWPLVAGLMACALVIPTALIAGAVRGIPLYWRLIDCSFGVLGALPLGYCLFVSLRLDD